MSGIVSGINYSILFASNGSSGASPSDAILNALYSGATATGTPTTFVSTGNPILDLKLAQQGQAKDIALEAKQPAVQATIAQFTKAVTNATSIQTALLNPYVQQVLLTTNGLNNYIGQTALVQKLFLSDPTDTKSLVNQLGDSTWLSSVQSYNFAKTGLAALQSPSVISTLTSAYAEVQWRQSLDQATPGLSNALDFLGKASSIKTISDVLATQTTFNVITTALGIPQQIVNQDTAAITSAINSRLDYTKLQDPSYVTSLTDQYLLTMQMNAQASTGAATDLTSLAVKAGGLMA